MAHDSTPAEPAAAGVTPIARPVSVGHRLFALLFSVLLVLGFTVRAAAQADPSAQPAPVDQAQPEPQEPVQPAEPATPPLILRDLSVFVLDHQGTVANDPIDYGSTLFNGAYRRRVPTTGNPLGPAMPLGIITLEGTLDTQHTLTLETASTHDDHRFLGHWPKTQARPHQLTWKAVRPATADLPNHLIPAGHYLKPLQSRDDRVAFTTWANPGRFFAYDLSIPIDRPITLAYTDEQYRLTYREPEHGKVMLIRNAAEGVSLGQIAAEAQSEAHTVVFEPVKADADPLDELAETLAQRGFNEAEQGYALSVVRQLALTKAGVTGICLLPRETLDTMLPLSLDPPADRIERVGIVVLTNIDPRLEQSLQQYVDQLGDESWAVRNQAQQTLISVGRAAIETVQAARNHEDPEVAYRVEQILDAYEVKYGELSDKALAE